MTDVSNRGQLPEPDIIKQCLPAVIQVVALKSGLLGGTSTAWTGSGTIVDPRGIILTNCHVANPRAMGMPAPNASKLGVAITTRSDEPPALTYLAEILVQSPELDLAVIRIVSDLSGKRVRSLNLPYIPIGDSDNLELADNLAIFGYPGIGGQTVTFTSGSVAGFNKQPNVNVRRAWIKTDATIAGGNSGGTAVNHDGYLVGIPTQAAAGTGINPVDARPVVDTNRDGRVDMRDSPIAIGGFINGLRPVNLAKPLLSKAGVKVSGAGSRTKVPMQVQQRSGSSSSDASSKSTTRGARFGNLVFSSRVTKDGRPINPADVMPSRSRSLYATFDFAGMRKGTAWGQTWLLNGKPVLQNQGKWSDGPSGRKTVSLSNKKGLPDGEYHLVLTVRKQVASEGKVAVGRMVRDTDTEVSGSVANARNGRPVSDALVIALKPGVSVNDFVRYKKREMAFTTAKTDRRGAFTFPQQLPKGEAYSLVVVAKGYKDLVVESGLRVSSEAPEKARMNPIPLQPA